MAKGVYDFIAAANAIWSGVSGINRVFTDPPGVPPSGVSGDLPCVIPVFTGLDWTAEAWGYFRKNLTLQYYLLVAPIGVDLANANQLALPFADSVPAAFFPFVQYGDGVNITHAGLDTNEPLGEMEYTKITWAGTDYYGFTVKLIATIKQELDQHS